jgi:negative regulator of sigma E activity
MTSDVNRSIEEQLSAFLDGELPNEELELLVRRLERNHEYRTTLARFSLIGNVLRKDPVQTYPDQFRARIMAAIAADTAQPAESEQALKSRMSWRAQFASAAAVVLAVVGLSSSGLMNWGAGPAGSVDSAPRLATVEAPAQLAVGVEKPVAPRSAPRGAARQSALNPDRFSSYMVSHREYAQSLHGPIANSRIVIQQARFEN